MSRRLHLTFNCEGSYLAGTLDTAPLTTGLLLVSGGNELRSGAFRGQARLAQTIAKRGFPVFRYDRRGVGDSEGENLGFTQSEPDIRAAIEARLPAPAYKLGPAKDDPLFEGLDIDFRPLDEAEFIICTGMKDDAHETPDDYREFLKEAATRRLPMVCANPDIVVNWGGRMIWCAGALAEIYKDLGCEVIYGGKPHPPIYDLALNRIESLRGPTERKRILAVGDGFKTDILGANNQKLDVIFIAGDGGVHEGARDAAAVSQKLLEAGLNAIGVAEGLKW